MVKAKRITTAQKMIVTTTIENLNLNPRKITTVRMGTVRMKKEEHEVSEETAERRKKGVRAKTINNQADIGVMKVILMMMPLQLTMQLELTKTRG